MRESVTAAYSYVRSKAKDLDIDDKEVPENDLSIHSPRRSDSERTGPRQECHRHMHRLGHGDRPVRHDVAMTGEITLAVSALRRRRQREVMAAQRANITTVVLPEGNRKDLTRCLTK